MATKRGASEYLVPRRRREMTPTDRGATSSWSSPSTAGLHRRAGERRRRGARSWLLFFRGGAAHRRRRRQQQQRQRPVQPVVRGERATEAVERVGEVDGGLARVAEDDALAAAVPIDADDRAVAGVAIRLRTARRPQRVVDLVSPRRGVDDVDEEGHGASLGARLVEGLDLRCPARRQRPRRVRRRRARARDVRAHREVRIRHFVEGDEDDAVVPHDDRRHERAAEPLGDGGLGEHRRAEALAAACGALGERYGDVELATQGEGFGWRFVIVSSAGRRSPLEPPSLLKIIRSGLVGCLRRSSRHRNR
mmetsp:Transcript_25490/g.101575  ORF Transcript_25490/g.101575 Transcript_25490/m.101575 type:complete len:307 (+) Transcript_25490:186-1106(+)